MGKWKDLTTPEVTHPHWFASGWALFNKGRLEAVRPPVSAGPPSGGQQYNTYKHYTNTYACEIITTHNKDERHSLLKNLPLTIFERVVCERELETKQNCNMLTPTLMAISVVSFSFSRVDQPEARGPSSLLGAGFLYHILSPNWSGIQKLLEFPVHLVI